AERGVAAAFGAPQRVALDRHGRAARPIVELGERVAHVGAVLAALYRERPLRRSRHEAARLEARRAQTRKRRDERSARVAETRETCGREHDRVVAALAQLRDARRHVAAQRGDDEIGPEMLE